MSDPAFAVIIPHYNDVVRLERCLGALAEQDLSGVEVVVADNSSDQSLTQLKTAFPDVRFVTEPQPGAALARNRGVAGTTAPWLIFLDADCVPAENWLATARKLAQEGTVIGGRVDVFDETPPPRSGAEAFEAVFAFDQRAYVEKKGFSVTANLIVSRAMFQDVGPFRAGLSEDLDWCHRATAKGYGLIYADELRVSHPSRADWPAMRKKWLRVARESFGLKPRTLGARASWGARALLMPASILAHGPRVLRHPALSAGEKCRALWMLARLRLIRMVWMLRQAATGQP